MSLQCWVEKNRDGYQQFRIHVLPPDQSESNVYMKHVWFLWLEFGNIWKGSCILKHKYDLRSTVLLICAVGSFLCCLGFKKTTLLCVLGLTEAQQCHLKPNNSLSLCQGEFPSSWHHDILCPMQLQPLTLVSSLGLSLCLSLTPSGLFPVGNIVVFNYACFLHLYFSHRLFPV